MLNLLVSCNNTQALLAAEQISFTVGCGWLGHGLDILLAANIDSDFHNRKITENIFRRNTEFRPVLRISRGWRLLRERALVPGGSFPVERTNHRLTFSSLPLLPQPNTDNWLGRKRGGLFKYATIYLFSLLSILREPVLLMVTLGSRDTSEMASTSFIQLTVGVGDPKHTANVHFLSLDTFKID